MTKPKRRYKPIKDKSSVARQDAPSCPSESAPVVESGSESRDRAAAEAAVRAVLDGWVGDDFPDRRSILAAVRERLTDECGSRYCHSAACKALDEAGVEPCS